MKFNHLALAILTLFAIVEVTAATHTISSPDGSANLSISEEQGQLFYELNNDGKTVVAKSSFGIIKDARYTVVDAKVSQHDSSWKPSFGQFSKIRDNHTQLEIQLNFNQQLN